MKKVLRCLFVAIALITLLSMAISVSASEDISVVLDGEKVVFDVPPMIVNGRTMVPVRAIFEALGATVKWDGTTSTATATKNSTTVKLTINSTTMYVNGGAKTIDAPAMIHDSRTLVPLRAVSEAFGCQVGWDGNNQVASIINDTKSYTMLYAPGGRSRSFTNSEVDAQLNVGWYRDAALKDNMTDEKIYNKLKLRADDNAFGCAETVVRNLHKNPATVTIYDRKIIDNDKYFRYIIKINASGMNAAGGYVTDDFYIMLRIKPNMDGTFEYYTGAVLGYEYTYLDKDKQAFGWGTRPSDFHLATQEKTPETVSVIQIVAFPERYVGKYVTVVEDFQIGINWIKYKKFHAYPLDEKGYCNTNASIDIYYNYVENIDDCVMSPDDRRFRVTGYVRTFSNSTEAYIDATIIEFK